MADATYPAAGAQCTGAPSEVYSHKAVFASANLQLPMQARDALWIDESLNDASKSASISPNELKLVPAPQSGCQY